MDIAIATLKHALLITAFVFMMMLLIEYINVLTRGVLTQRLRRGGWQAYILAILLASAIGVAAAGGSGGGIVSCQQVLERYFQHLRCRIFDMIPVTHYSRIYKVDVARAAGAALSRYLAEETRSA